MRLEGAAVLVVASPPPSAAAICMIGRMRGEATKAPRPRSGAVENTMANYEAPILMGTVSTAYKTAGALWSVGSRRIMVYEIEMGQTGGLSSSDTQCQWDVSVFSSTNILTATAVIPNKLDPADGTALSIYANNATTELTYTTAGNGLALKNWGINQRGSYRWRALDDGDNLIIPATNLVGIGIRTLSTSFTGSAVGNVSFVER
jgi:hypothetical protein